LGHPVYVAYFRSEKGMLMRIKMNRQKFRCEME